MHDGRCSEYGGTSFSSTSFLSLSESWPPSRPGPQPDDAVPDLGGTMVLSTECAQPGDAVPDLGGTMATQPDDAVPDLGGTIVLSTECAQVGAVCTQHMMFIQHVNMMFIQHDVQTFVNIPASLKSSPTPNFPHLPQEPTTPDDPSQQTATRSQPPSKNLRGWTAHCS